MLEDRRRDSYLISRVFSSSCISETNWSYMYPLGNDDDENSSETKLNNGKRPLEVEDDLEKQHKSLRLMGFSISNSINLTPNSIPQSQDQEQEPANFNVDSLINYIGRDNSVLGFPINNSIDLTSNSNPQEQDQEQVLEQDQEQGDSDVDSLINYIGRDNSIMGFSINNSIDLTPNSNVQDQEQEQDQEQVLEQEQEPVLEQDQEQGDSDGESLINYIGRDNSISCLIRCSRSNYGSIASLNRSFRSLVKSGEIYRLRKQYGIIEHWVYFSCQLLEWVAFNPIERRWMELPRMPSSVTFMCADKESLAVGTDLLVLGKDDYSSHVIYRYSLLTNSWSSDLKMNSPRCLFGSASLGEIAIFAGGCDSRGKISNSAEMYNSELQSWTTLPDMNKPRKMCSGVFMDGKFYVIGGIGGEDCKVLTCGEEFDLEKREWSEIAEMSPPRSHGNAGGGAAEAPPLVAVVNNELYAADHADMEVRKFDKKSRKWFSLGRLPERADSVNGWGLAFKGCGDRVVVIGGPKNSGGGYIELNSWVPSENGEPPIWTLLDRKHSSNFVYNCAVMGC